MLARAVRVVLTLMAVATIVVVATPGRASAHADLVGTAPGNGEHLDAAPAQVRLRFSERVHLVTDAMILFDADGDRLQTAAARTEGDTDVVLDVPVGLGDGVYTVIWRVVSADSHPIHGAFVFSVGAATVAALAEGGARAGADRALGAVFWVVRLLGYTGLALFAGGLLFLTLCWPAGWHSPRARRLLTYGWGTSLACAAAALLLQGPYAAGRSIAGAADPALLRGTVATEYGSSVIARLVVLALAGGLLLTARSVSGRLLDRTRMALTTIAAIALPATWPATGHASTGGVLPLIVTTLHVIAMVAWLGGLALLFTCVLPGAADEAPRGMGRPLSRFSRLAMICVGVLVVTGIYQAWQGLGGLSAFAGSSYGSLLAFKLAILAVLLSFGALSRSIVARSYAPAPASTVEAPRAMAVAVRSGGTVTRRSAAGGRSGRRAERAERERLASLRGRLQRAVGIEAGIAVLILGLTSVLVATPPGRPDVVPVRLDVPLQPRSSGPFAVDLALAGGGSVHLVVDPPRVGRSRVAIDVRDSAGRLLDVPEVTASLVLDARDVGPLPIALERSAPGQYAASAVNVPFAGTWQVRVTVRTTDFDQTTVVTDMIVS